MMLYTFPLRPPPPSCTPSAAPSTAVVSTAADSPAWHSRGQSRESIRRCLSGIGNASANRRLRSPLRPDHARRHSQRLSPPRPRSPARDHQTSPLGPTTSRSPRAEKPKRPPRSNQDCTPPAIPLGAGVRYAEQKYSLPRVSFPWALRAPYAGSPCPVSLSATRSARQRNPPLLPSGACPVSFTCGLFAEAGEFQVNTSYPSSWSASLDPIVQKGGTNTSAIVYKMFSALKRGSVLDHGVATANLSRSSLAGAEFSIQRFSWRHHRSYQKHAGAEMRTMKTKARKIKRQR